MTQNIYKKNYKIHRNRKKLKKNSFTLKLKKN